MDAVAHLNKADNPHDVVLEGQEEREKELKKEEKDFE